MCINNSIPYINIDFSITNRSTTTTINSTNYKKANFFMILLIKKDKKIKK